MGSRLCWFPEFVEIEADGVYDKAGSVKSVGMFDASKFELSDWKAAKIDNDAALDTYLVKSTDPKWDTERHTTIWANRGGKWMALLHIGTPVAKPPTAKPEAGPEVKLVLRGGKSFYEGKWQTTDIGIDAGGKLRFGTNLQAPEIMDVTSKVIAPGFIDILADNAAQPGSHVPDL